MGNRETISKEVQQGRNKVIGSSLRFASAEHGRRHAMAIHTKLEVKSEGQLATQFSRTGYCGFTGGTRSANRMKDIYKMNTLEVAA